MIFYWPIILYWQLPISVMSIFGNILFPPILLVFMSLAILLFFTEILFIPNQTIVSLLEIFSDLWIKILNIGDKNWLIYTPNLHPILLFAIISIPILITVLAYKRTKFFDIRIIIIIISLLSFLSILFRDNKISKEIVCQNLDNKTLKELVQEINKSKISKIIILNFDEKIFNTNSLKLWQHLLYTLKNNNISLEIK